nr:phage protein Gp27 family protein [uncultured Sphaerochaeta sp.]
MPRRSKADLAGVIERIVQMYEVEKHSIKDIEKILQKEGLSISRESIRRTLKSSKSVASQYKKAAEEAKVLIDAVRDNPNTDVVELTTSLLTKQVFDFVQSIDDLDFDNPNELILAINRLSSAQVRISKQRLNFQNGYNEAKADILRQIKDELSLQPELLENLARLVSSMEAPK